MEFYPTEDRSLEGSTLIVPAVSLGNVGQLSIDLIVETNHAPRVGRLSHPALLPVAGAANFSHLSGASFPLELFALPTTSATPEQIFILQQRSSAAPGLQQTFAEDLVEWARSVKIGQIFILGSLDARFRHGRQLQSESRLRSWSPEENTAQFADKCADAGAPRLEEDYEAEGKPLENRLTPPWPLLRACRSAEIPCVAFMAFVLEGDNAIDGMLLADALGKALPAVAPPVETSGGRWQHPPSWKFAFGNGPPIGL